MYHTRQFVKLNLPILFITFKVRSQESFYENDSEIPIFLNDPSRRHLIAEDTSLDVSRRDKGGELG